MEKQARRELVKVARELTYPYLEKLVEGMQNSEDFEKVAEHITENLSAEEQQALRDSHYIGVGIARGIMLQKEAEYDPTDTVQDMLLRIGGLYGEETMNKIAEDMEEQLMAEEDEEAEIDEAIAEGVLEAIEEALPPEAIAAIEEDEELAEEVAAEIEEICEQVKAEMMAEAEGYEDYDEEYE